MPDKILEKHTAQQKQYFHQNRPLLQKLVQEGQQPDVLFITCSDSRIMAEGMLGLKAGDFFVHRNIAACVPPYVQPEISTTAVLEFAVMTLKVKHIIVCGHTDCGGVLKVDDPPSISDMPALSRWLDHIQPARRDVDATSHDLAPAERHHAIVERHVVNQLTNLRSYPFVREAENQGELTLHGWVDYLDEQTLRYYDEQIGYFIEE
jgi:carbonic anhydrase